MACHSCEERRKMIAEAYSKVVGLAGALTPRLYDALDLRRSFDSEAFMANFRKSQRSAPSPAERYKDNRNVE